ncbi:MAG: C39 family peptidase [Planctomycetaceae bacterium]
MALILMTLTSLWALLAGVRLGQTASSRSQQIIQILVMAAYSAYFLFVWNRPLLSLYLPHTALIVLTNWHPVMGCFFAGMYLSTNRICRRRRLAVAATILLLSGYSIAAPVLGHAPACEPTASGSPLITQTTPYTCSPAAAASLLRLHGIAATESQMADLCLTRQGTHWMGVYRGLTLMTRNTNWDVVAEPFSRAAVMRLDESPALLSVNIDTDLITTREDHGFRDGAGHSVLTLGARDGLQVMVFDPSPSYGIEYWDRRLLSWVSNGVILRLVSRSGSGHEIAVRERISAAAQQHNRFVSVNWDPPM